MTSYTASVYTEKFQDEHAWYFTAECFPQLDFTKEDCTECLRGAIRQIYEEQGYGVLYIPEGKYIITDTIYIPRAVRLIGYGGHRPCFILPQNTVGFDGKHEEKGFYTPFTYKPYPGAKYLFWFTTNLPDLEGGLPADANAGTFYSALSNIDIRIEHGNPGAVAIRAHFAQHCFVSYCRLEIGEGLAAFYEVGNEMEKLVIEGGEYGIITDMTAPGWPFLLADSCLTGQRKAGIMSRECGLTLIRIEAENMPCFLVPYREPSWEKLYMEDCRFRQITDCVMKVYFENSLYTQLSARNVYCSNVNGWISFLESGERMEIPHRRYLVENFCHGVQCGSLEEKAEQKTVFQGRAVAESPRRKESDMPLPPGMGEWVSIKEFGAIGDGKTDDTAALCQAASSGRIVFLPCGDYLVTDTVSMAEGTVFIGMSPVAARIIVADDTEAYAGFGEPKAVVETGKGMNCISGIGIDSCKRNPRAVDLLWRAGKGSYLNDVKFFGGHGYVAKSTQSGGSGFFSERRETEADPWDCRYSSLWILGGGGTFKDIWSASPYAEAGILISDTETEGRMYCISVEHHVRNEVKIRNVRNFCFYAIQTEEEKSESYEALPYELTDCRDLCFYNVWLYRVTTMTGACRCAMELWNCEEIEFRNLHCYTQHAHTFDALILDAVKGVAFQSWEAARVWVTGKEQGREMPVESGLYKLAEGFKLTSGAAVDSKGNLAFCDPVTKRIYRYLRSEERLELLLDIHYKPACLAFDRDDRLLVVIDEIPVKTDPGLSLTQMLVSGGKFHMYFSLFGERRERVYEVDPAYPYKTIHALERICLEDACPEIVYLPGNYCVPHSFLEYALQPYDEVYLAEDGVTAVAGKIDIGRALTLVPVLPDDKVLVIDDDLDQVWKFRTDDKFQLKEPEKIFDRGKYSLVRDGKRVILPDGELYLYSEGEVQSILLPGRVTVVADGGDILYLLGIEKLWYIEKEKLYRKMGVEA